MARAAAWHADPKKLSSGYLYHWKTADGWDRTFRDPELLTMREQIARVKELKRGWRPDPSQMSYAEAEGRREMIDSDPTLANDPEFWATSYPELVARGKYD